MPSHLKTEVSTSDFEAETISGHSLRLTGKARLFSTIDSARLGLTVVALAAGIVVLGVSADALAVYRDTHLPEEFMLPLWPAAFNLRPTIAMVASGAFVVAVNAAVLLVSNVKTLRSNVSINTATNLAAPLVSFIVALVAMVYYYTVNASEEVDTMQSWSCRWRNVVMMTEPHFGTLCRQSEAGLALSVMLVPLEFILLCVTGYQVVLARGVKGEMQGRRKGGSPTPS